MFILLLIVGFAAGIAVAVLSGLAGSFAGKKNKELAHERRQLSTARNSLQRIATGLTGDPTLEADLALSEINLKETDYLEGRR